NPDSVYALKVYFQGDKSMYRIIEIASEDVLDALHWAIQNALGWDDEHLYSFYMNGEKYNEWYQIACPYEEDARVHTTEIRLGELGLGLKAKFLYHFDYGDDHRFDVEVIGIQPKEAG